MRLISIALTIMLILAGTITVSAAAVLRVPQDFATIQAAVDNALPGDMIAVSRGVFSENVLIMDKTDLRLRGANTVLDGSGVGGMGIGIEVVNSYDISIQNFLIEGYEAGIVLEGSHHSSVRNVETRFNDSGTASLRDGLQLVGSHHNHISNVDAHHNGHNGITLKEGSSDNTLRGNSANDNGQNAAVAANLGGCGVQLIGGGNHNNAIMENETLRNGWGIQVGGGSNGNHVGQNRSHANQRAGVVVLNSGADNFIGQNNATGNGLANESPSGVFDLFDQGVLDNIWRNNQGSFNF